MEAGEVVKVLAELVHSIELLLIKELMVELVVHHNKVNHVILENLVVQTIQQICLVGLLLRDTWVVVATTQMEDCLCVILVPELALGHQQQNVII